MKYNRLCFLLFCFFLVFSRDTDKQIDGIAAIVEKHIVLKSDLLQMINMAALQNKIDPTTNPEKFKELEVSILQSMVDQKIMLEMAAADSIQVEEKEVTQALEQQVQMFIAQAGGEKNAELALGQSLRDFKREFWYDMQDRLISEKYQQQLIGSISITKTDVIKFFKIYKDSLPNIPMRAKIRHILISVKPNQKSKQTTIKLLEKIKDQIKKGQNFSDLAKKHSQDPGSKNNGGSLGWVNRGSLVKNFEALAFTSAVGNVVGPIETEFGFHILETLEKQGDKIKVRHILIIPEITNDDNERSYNFAMSLKNDSIKTLDNFKSMVLHHTNDEITKKIGGDLGWIDPQNYTVPEIGQAIKYLNVNSCSPPINSPLGFHLLWVENIKKGGRPNKKDHWPEIEEMALNKKKMIWYQEWVENARKQFYVEIKSE